MGNRHDELTWWKEQKDANGYETFSQSIAPGVSTLAFWVAQQILDGKDVPKDLVVPTLRIDQDGLAEGLEMTPEVFYDEDRVAIVPMGFCYPGKASGGDKPPRRECAPQWHARVLDVLPDDRLTLLVGTYAQAHYLPQTSKLSMTERVRAFRDHLPHAIPLPHPAWRSTLWMRQNPWFEAEVLPVLREAIARHI